MPKSWRLPEGRNRHLPVLVGWCRVCLRTGKHCRVTLGSLTDLTHNGNCVLSTNLLHAHGDPVENDGYFLDRLMGYMCSIVAVEADEQHAF